TRQSEHAERFGSGEEFLVQIRVFQRKDDVHVGSVCGRNGAGVKASGGLDGCVDKVGLLPVQLLDSGKAAVLFQELEDLSEGVDGEHRGSVVEAVGLGVGCVFQVGTDVAASGREEVVADDDKGRSGGSEVLLCASVDE